MGGTQMKGKVNRNSIVRLAQYKNVLSRLQLSGVERVYSDNLAAAVGVTSAQVRKDFSVFGISGNKRGGYEITQLVENLSHLLGKNRQQKVVIVGVGNIGRALIHYPGFEPEGITIVAGFDIAPPEQFQGCRIPILPVDQLEEYIRANGIQLGIICVPDAAAQPVCDRMVAAGIEGILNFAPMRLTAQEGVHYS